MRAIHSPFAQDWRQSGKRAVTWRSMDRRARAWLSLALLRNKCHEHVAHLLACLPACLLVLTEKCRRRAPVRPASYAGACPPPPHSDAANQIGLPRLNLRAYRSRLGPHTGPSMPIYQDDQCRTTEPTPAFAAQRALQPFRSGSSRPTLWIKSVLTGRFLPRTSEVYRPALKALPSLPWP